MTDTGTGWLTCPNAATCVVVRRTVACSEPGMLHPDCENKYHPKAPVIVVGDSKQPHQRPLVFTLPEWAELVRAVKAGEHDQLTTDMKEQ